MDLASAAAIMSAAVGGVTLATVIFRGGRQSAKLDQVDISVNRIETKFEAAVDRLEQKFNGHVHDSGDHHAAVMERLIRVETRTEVDR